MKSSRVLWILTLVGVGLVAARILAAPASPRPSGETRTQADDDPSRPRDCVVKLESIVISADEAGRIKEFRVEEGQDVSEKALLALIDDSQSQMAKKIAYYKLKMAEFDARNEVSVRYAQKGKDLAEVEYKQNVNTNEIQPNSVSIFDLRRSWFKVQEQELAIEEAQHKLGVAKVTAEERGAELDAAELDIRRREIRSPCFGRVEQRKKMAGEWVKPGDPVLQILKTDVVRVKGSVDANRLTPADVEGRPVRVTVLVKGRPESFEGTVGSASYVIVAGRFAVTAVVKNRKDNGHWFLRDNMEAEMVIDLKK